MAKRYGIGHTRPKGAEDAPENADSYFIYEEPFRANMPDSEMIVVFRCSGGNRILMRKLALKMCDYMNHLDRVLHGVIDETAL